MALTRKFLKALGIDDEKVDQIIEAHSETVEALKEERDSYKKDAEKLPDVQAKLDAAEKKLPKEGEETVLKSEYDKIKTEYENYKSSVSAKETHSAKERAYRDMLKAAGVSEKRIDSVLKVSDVDGVELDKDGKIKDESKYVDNVKTEWADFIVTQSTQGANTATPPTNNQSTKDPFLEGFGE